MVTGTMTALHATRTWLAKRLGKPALVATLPAICLAAYWGTGPTGLIVLAITAPMAYLLLSALGPRSGLSEQQRDPATGLFHRASYDAFVSATFSKAEAERLHSATFAIAVDDADRIAARYGQAAADLVVKRLGERICSSLRATDAVVDRSDFRFAACLAPVSQMDLELGIQVAGRIQSAIEEAISVDGIAIYVTASVGFCLHSRAPKKQPDDWMNAAKVALSEAQRNGPGSIRAYSEELGKRAKSRVELQETVAGALETGQIIPWFQPQISTDTGMLTGFEALARWQHPSRGMISPAEFLPAIDQAGLLERLAEVMIFHSFSALKAWDHAGVHVPQVGVNFAGPELRNPNLVEKISWELGRFDLTPDRLAVEVLETVVTGSADDVTTRNVNNLAKLGCRIDLDDFGTGHASLSSIRRFSVTRIKIDRSFVMKSDRDPEQQRMIGAILTMAERLGVETLAEGVETAGEHALLAQLGCNHVQGFGIGKPMPFPKTESWIREHNSKLVQAPRILGGHSK